MTHKEIIEKSFKVLTDILEQVQYYIEADLLVDFYTSFINYDENPILISYETAKTFMLKSDTNYKVGLRTILHNLDFISIERKSYISDIFIHEDCTLYTIQEYGAFTFVVCNKINNEVMLVFKTEVIKGEHYISVLFNEDSKKYQIDTDFINFLAYSIILAQTPALPKKRTYKIRQHKKILELL